MEWIDLAVLIVAIVIVISVINYYRIKKKMGQRGGCGGGCSHCPMGGQCPSKVEEEESGDRDLQ